MLSDKISITISPHLNQFAENYQINHQLKSKSEVIAQALKLLEKMTLESRYRQMAEDLKNNPSMQADFDAWEHTAGDGLDDEDW